MTPEQAFYVAVIGTLASIISPIVVWFLSRRKQASEVVLNIAQSASELAEGGEKAINAAMRMMEKFELDNKQLRDEVQAQRQEIMSLKTQHTAMQIDNQAKEARTLAKMDAFEAYIKLLIDIMRENGITNIPSRPDILKESQPRIKAIR